MDLPHLDLSLGLPVLALLLAALVVADFFIPMLPSATLIATLSGFLVERPALAAGLIACTAVASWLGDVLGYRALRGARGRFSRLLASPKAARVEARIQATLERSPVRTTLVARFLPAGRTALAWAAVSAPAYRHGRMAALAAFLWASYMVGLGLCIGWLLGPGLYSAATTITSIAAATAVLGWWFQGAGAAPRVLGRTAENGEAKPAIEPTPPAESAAKLES